MKENRLSYLLPITTVLAEDGLYLGCGVNHIKNKVTAIILCSYYYKKNRKMCNRIEEADYQIR